MTTTRTRPLVLLAAPLTALVTVLSGCGLDQVAGSDSRAVEPTSSQSSSAPSPTGSDEGSAETDRVVQPEDPACAPGEGKQVEEIDDVVIPAFTWDEFTVEDETVGDVVIPGFTVPGFSMPETVVEGGCVVRYDAPGACLGAVEIVGAEVPPARVPDAEVPPVVVDGETLFAGESATGGEADGSSVEGERVEQTCQEKPAETGDDFFSSVFRESLFRGSLFRETIFRASMHRPAICVDRGDRQECSTPVTVPTANLAAQFVPAQFVEPGLLPSYTVEGAPDTTVYTGDEKQSYVTPAEVLFDFDKSEIKPAAATSLAAIAAKIEAGATVVVEGHTDDQGTDAYNQTLSEARAEAVAAWLVANGGVASGSVSTTGLGESAPAASNSDEAGRAQNRRVVITVTAP